MKQFMPYKEGVVRRWLNKEGRSSQLGSWVPFSAGPRMCIGYGFALQEIKVCNLIRSQGFFMYMSAFVACSGACCPKALITA